MKKSQGVIKIGIAGLGTIGTSVALHIDQGRIPRVALAGIFTRDTKRAKEFSDQLRQPVPIVGIDELAELSDAVVECLPAELLPSIARPVLAAGKSLIVLSASALLENPTLKDVAEEFGGTIHIPTGALLGLDAVNAAAEGTIFSAHMITRKPPRGLRGAPHLTKNNIELDDTGEPQLVFSGNVREAALGFPANVNVSAALSLAGIGPDATTIEVWADPTVTRNTHRIEIESDSASISMTIRGVPSANPKTGIITARSVIALLRKMTASVRVGT